MKKNEWSEGLNHLDDELVEKYVEQKDRLRQKNKKIKRIRLRLGTIAACFTLIAGIVIIVPMLQKNPDTTHTHTTESTDCTEDINKYNNSDYSIIKNDDGYSIIFENSEKYKVSDDMLACMIATIDFPSMKEFKDSVTKGLLTDSQKQIIANAFPKNKDGSIKCCDFNNLYVPTLPDGCAVNAVGWGGGESYSFYIDCKKAELVYSHYYTKDIFEERYKKDYQQFLYKSSIVVTKTETSSDGKEIAYFETSSGKFKRVSYTISDGNKTVTVDKMFRLEFYNDNFDFPTSSTIPSSIYLYCTSEDLYNIVYLHDFYTDPADEWLLTFGLEKFIDK